MTFCYEGTGSSEYGGIPFTVECEISSDGDEMHCGGVHDGHHDAKEEESHMFVHQIAPGIFVEFNVEGRALIDPPLQLVHMSR